MLNQEARRQSVQGVQVLLLKGGPYIEVAERVRAVHKAGRSFSFDRGEVLTIRNTWMYRAYISVNERQYIGDAEIHFGAPKDTPNGTNPITCGQTSAIGNALAFAGFGTLKSVLARLGQRLENEVDLPSEQTRQVIQGVEVVMLDDEPYVDVAERIYSVHQANKAFSIQMCKILQYNDVWIYRAHITVGERQYIGDAEIYFDADKDTPDGLYPIACGQTSAVGNALAFAGFGNVRSILEQLGNEEADTVEMKSSLASADAVIRAKGHASSSNKLSNERSENSSVNHSSHQKIKVTAQQQTTIRELCERLGENEPDYAQMTFADAEIFILQLQLSEEELLHTAEEVRQQDVSQDTEHSKAPVSLQATEIVSKDAVGHLKQTWLDAFQIAGTVDEKRARWMEFKKRVCKMEVSDDVMSNLQHQQLHDAIADERARKQGNS